MSTTYRYLDTASARHSGLTNQTGSGSGTVTSGVYCSLPHHRELKSINSIASEIGRRGDQPFLARCDNAERSLSNAIKRVTLNAGRTVRSARVSRRQEAALEWATQTGRHALGPLSLQSGATLPAAELSWKTYGALAPARDNVISYPTGYSAHHTDLEPDWT